MSEGRTTPEAVSHAVEEYLGQRQAEILPAGDQSTGGRRFTWCGDVLEFLVEGLAERLAARGITFTSPFPGPLRLWDEDQQPDGQHVRRFWTTALERGCPIAKLCTFFFHRHDTPALPRAPKVVGFPPDYLEEPERDRG
ncbi:MAG: hypothetical protein AB1411_13845 [Nitrospirota bacterium]